MKQNRNCGRPATFRSFERKAWSAFRSLSLEVRIGVLSVATLGSVTFAKAAPAGDAVAERVEAEEQEAEDLSELTVSATLAPLSQLEQVRLVSVLQREDVLRSGAQSVNDLLKLFSGVDVRQRGPYGVQTDISVDGGIQEQVTLLLNGVNVSNPQTGHLTFDLPVALEDIERIEVLEGAAGRVYGGSSFGGVINIITRTDSVPEVTLRAEGGQYGTAAGSARAAFSRQSFSGGYSRSDGGTVNDDFWKSQAYHSGSWRWLRWQAGYSQKQYGANTFYSPKYPNQWEENMRLMASLAADIPLNSKLSPVTCHLSPEVYWQRNYDHFQLIRGTSTGENEHRSNIIGAKAKLWWQWVAGKTAVAAEMRHERYSKAAIDTSRTVIHMTLEHNVTLGDWTLSAGVTGQGVIGATSASPSFYPGVDVAWRPAAGWKLMLGYNRGYRLPTFTELFYQSPTHEGNKNLTTEKSHNVSLAAQYRTLLSEPRGLKGVFSARTFYHRGHGLIDWVMFSPGDAFRSAAFELDNIGVQADAAVTGRRFRVQASYTFLHQLRHDDIAVFRSNYAMEYLRHKLVVTGDWTFWRYMGVNASVRYHDRMGDYTPYATLDLKLRWTDPRYEVWVQGNNVTDTHYTDIGGVPQPGIWVTAGVKWRIL